MTRMIFIGATGTDMGKTYVTCMLIRQLRQQGYNVRAIKPVISGFDEDAIAQSDSGLLLGAMALSPTLDNVKKISPWRAPEPLPPHLVLSPSVTLAEIITFCQSASREEDDFLLIEGAGGIMTPLNYNHTTLDMMAALDCSCLLVTGSYLGTLSHTATAVKCLEQRKIRINGMIISESPDNYTGFKTVMTDFSKLFPHIPIKGVGRDDMSQDFFSLLL